MGDLTDWLSGGRENHGEGEPEWMPSAQEVARARAQMERQGIVRSLSRGGPLAEAATPTPPTPWLWWGAAALWIIIWPALVALRLTTNALLWVPWWLPLLLAPLHMLGLAAPVLLSERDRSRDAVRRRFGRVHTLPQMLALEPGEFENWSGMLFQLMGYRVDVVAHTGDHGIDLQVTNPRVRRGLVQCKRYRGTVGEPVVRDLYGTMMHEGADCGWLVTTGGISRQAHEWAGAKPIELLDGQKLVQLAARYR
jgi:restriction system protein